MWHYLYASLGWLLALMFVLIGYVVAPVAFNQLTQVDAGQLVGALLTYINVFSLAMLAWMLVVAWWFKDTVNTFVMKGVHVNLMLLALSVLLLLVMQFGIAPAMESIKQTYPDGLTRESADWSRFAMWHGIYQLFNLLLIFFLLMWSFFQFKCLKTK